MLMQRIQNLILIFSKEAQDAFDKAELERAIR